MSITTPGTVVLANQVADAISIIVNKK